MLTGRFPDAGERDPEELLAAYLDVLSDVIDEHGTEVVVAETELSRTTVDALAGGTASGDDAVAIQRAGEITLADAAAVLALSGEFPDADAVAAQARDILLMGMTTAVMDVDAVAARLGGDLGPKTIQQKIEGRHPITLDEYARIHHLLEADS